MKKAPLVAALGMLGGAGYLLFSSFATPSAPTQVVVPDQVQPVQDALAQPSPANPASALTPAMPASVSQQQLISAIPAPVGALASVLSLADDAPRLTGSRDPGPGQPFAFYPPAQQAIKAQDANVAKEVVLKAGKQLLRVGEHDDLALKSSKIDAQGNSYFKFEQKYQGLVVQGREVVVQIGQDDAVAAVMGEFESDIQLDTLPALSSQAATDRAFSALPAGVTSPLHYLESPDLRVFVDDTGPVLAWRAVVEYSNATEGQRIDEVYIDANQGTLLARYSRIHSALSRQLYSLNNKCLSDWNMASSLPGTSISASADEHARSAWDNAGYTYGFYDKMFKRDSFDGKGIAIKSSVHALFSDPYGGCSGDNAVFLPDRNHIIYGDGGRMLRNPAGALDIVAHELTHGVTFHESNLVYQNESGAINEALSDIFGAGAETYVASGGSVTSAPAGGLKPNANSWLIGEKSAQDPSYRRNMRDPASDGRSRDSYDSRYVGQDDNGGVHINSGIMNLAFYLLSEGGKHPRGKSSTQVEGIGMKKALDIYYHANTNLFTQSTNFSSARTRLAQSAETLYGKCAKEWHSLHKSFDAVKVPGNWTPCNGGGGTGGGDTGGGTGGGDSGHTGGSIASVQVSSQYSSYYGASRLNDGAIATPWLSQTIWNTGAQQWIMLDMGSRKAIGAAEIHWNGSLFARQYEVWVWNNRWELVRSVNQYAPGTASVPVNRDAQHLLITLRNGYYGRWYGINEITLK